MSLFQFGFTHSSSSSSEPNSSSQAKNRQSISLPTLEESGLGQVEYDHVVESVSDLVDPDGEPNARKKKSSRGTHTQYTPEDRAQIGRYVCPWKWKREGTKEAFQPNFPTWEYRPKF